MIDKKNKTVLRFFWLIITILGLFVVNKIGGIIGNTQYNFFQTYKTIELIILSFKEDLFTLYWNKEAIFCMVVLLAFAICIIGYIETSYKSYMPGVEHGSAKWAGKKECKEVYKTFDDEDNLILSKTERMSIDNYFTQRNNNTVLLAGPGKGKTRNFVTPNMLQANTSFVLTDPKGTTRNTIEPFLINEKDYHSSNIDLIDFSKSQHYNPFKYLECEEDVASFVTALIENTTNPDSRSEQQYWVDAEKLLYNALISYIITFADKETKTMPVLNYLLSLIDVDENDSDGVNVIDLMIKDAENEYGNLYCVAQYKKFRVAAGKTLKSILSTTGARLQALDIPKLQNILEDDELELDLLGERKSVLFIVSDDMDSTYDFIVALLQNQIISINKKIADRNKNGRLKVPIHFIFDEFANISVISKFQRIISTIRSRNMWCSVILQGISQIKSKYKNDWETIIGSSDIMIYMGSSDMATCKYISEKLGKATIDIRSVSDSRGNNAHYSISNQLVGRDLMTPAELSLLPIDKCIVFIAGLNPFYSNKFVLKSHKNYKYVN